jgi:hypothetical protein
MLFEVATSHENMEDAKLTNLNLIKDLEEHQFSLCFSKLYRTDVKRSNERNRMGLLGSIVGDDKRQIL